MFTDAKRERRLARERARAISPEGTLRRIYKNQRSHSVERGHAMPDYSLQELLDRYLDDPEFQRLHLLWLAGGMQIKDRPSLDRKDDRLGYSLDNITLTTWAENDARGREAKRVPVIVVEPGGAIRRFASHAEARESLGISTRHHGRSVVNSGRPTKGCYVYTAEFYTANIGDLTEILSA